MELAITGLVLRIESKHFYVYDDLDNKIRICSLRGKFKKDFALKRDKLSVTDLVVVGDKVRYTIIDEKSGVIEDVFPRRNFLSRKATRMRGSTHRGERLEQIIAANLDCLFIVTSVDQPNFNNKTLDRFLVTAESAHIQPAIILNKMDLDLDDIMGEWIELYREIGYDVFPVSAIEQEGFEEIADYARNKKSIVWGHSGVGKSSVLNALYPSLLLKTGDISYATNKGTHTTVTVTLYMPEPDTFLIDTPGIREIEPYGIRKEDLAHYFKEFVPYLNECRFSTCTHEHEPGCGVLAAAEAGQISGERFDSYLRMLQTIEDDINF